MGIWDHQLADLESIGIRFSDAEVRAMEDPAEGLQVLHLQPLWDPETPEGQVNFMEDRNGIIYVPEILDVWNPLWRKHGSREGEEPLLIETVDTEYGILREGYPFYIGTVDMNHEPTDTPMSMYRSDEPAPYPFHGCMPVETEMEVAAARRLIDYARAMLRDSLYEELDFVVRVEQDSEWVLQAEPLWRQVYDPDFDLDEKSKDLIREALGDWHDGDTIKASLVSAFDQFIKAGFIPSPLLTKEQQAAYVHQPMVIGPLEDYIPDDDFMAKDFYVSLKTRQRHFQSRWSHDRGQQALWGLYSREGVYA